VFICEISGVFHHRGEVFPPRPWGLLVKLLTLLLQGNLAYFLVAGGQPPLTRKDTTKEEIFPLGQWAISRSPQIYQFTHKRIAPHILWYGKMDGYTVYATRPIIRQRIRLFILGITHLPPMDPVKREFDV
jgi:hypothetical protein